MAWAVWAVDFYHSTHRRNWHAYFYTVDAFPTGPPTLTRYVGLLIQWAGSSPVTTACAQEDYSRSPLSSRFTKGSKLSKGCLVRSSRLSLWSRTARRGGTTGTNRCGPLSHMEESRGHRSLFRKLGFLGGTMDSMWYRLWPEHMCSLPSRGGT